MYLLISRCKYTYAFKINWEGNRKHMLTVVIISVTYQAPGNPRKIYREK